MPPFDPYYKWLGIPKAEQPPNHYRLLGIAIFETDPDVIEAAADRQMTYVSQCATGEHMKLSQQVLNELSKARVCLLVADKKQAYDARLKSTLDEAQKIESSRVPVPIAETDDLSEEVKPVSGQKKEETFGRQFRRGRETRADRAVAASRSSKPLLIGGGIAAAAVLVIGIFVSTRPKPANKIAETASPISQPVQPPAQPAKLAETTEKPVGTTPAVTQPKPRGPKRLEVLEAKYGAPGHWTDLTERFQKASKSGMVGAVCNNSLVGSDPLFGVRKHLMLRYRIDGRDFEFTGSDMDSAVVVDTRPNPDVEAGPALKIHEAKFGGTILGERPWQDVTDQITSKIKDNQLKVAVRDVVQPRSDAAFLLIRWSTQGSTWTSFFHLEDTVVLGTDIPAVVNLQKDRQQARPADSPLVVLEAQYGTRGTWVDLTDRIRAASASGILAVVANGTTVPIDPVPSKSKHFRIRFLLDGRTFDHIYDEGSFIYLDGRAIPEVPEKGIKVLQAYCGQGIYGELQNGQPRMFDITEHLQSLVRDDQLNCSMGDATKTIQYSVSPKWFLIRYAFNGEIHQFLANEIRPTEIVLP